MKDDANFVVIWRFRARGDRVASFIQAYGPNGLWAQLFRKATGFVSTQLLCERSRSDHFLTIDTWTSHASYVAFRNAFAEEYDANDRMCADLSGSEELVADYLALPSNRQPEQ